jgi:hypothetical protein
MFSGLKAILALVVSLPLLQAQDRGEMPPLRVKFSNHPVPAGMQVGKLWWDVGFFHPFPSVSHDAWDTRYFSIMNKSIASDANPRLLIAEALGALNDQGSMVLDEEEGRGPNALPLIYEYRENGLWVVGGDKSQIQQAHGPISHINGETVDEFIAKHVGKTENPSQIISVVMTSAQRVKPFKWELRSPAGNLTINSVSSIPKEVWVQGGFRGTPISQCIVNADLKTNAGIDLRMLHWFNAIETDRMGYYFAALMKRAKSTPTVKVFSSSKGVRHPIDFLGSDPLERSGYGSIYWNVLLSENIDEGNPQGIEIQAAYPDAWPFPSINQSLAGWLLPTVKVRPSAAVHRYSISPKVEIQLTTQTFQAQMDPRQGKVDTHYKGNEELTSRAAIMLTAASLANFSTLFGFLPEEKQEPFFEALIRLSETASSTSELLQKVAPFHGDAHANDHLFKYGLVKPGSNFFAANSQAPTTWLPTELNSYFPFQVFEQHGKAIVIQTASSEIPTGSEVVSVNEKPVVQLIAKAKEIDTQGKDDKVGRFAWVIPSLLHNSFDQASYLSESPKGTPVGVEVRRDGETQKIKTFLTNTEQTLAWLPTSRKVPAGWEILNQERSLSVDEVIKKLNSGINLIVDLRWPYPKFPIQSSYRLADKEGSRVSSVFARTPSVPAAWGEVDSYSSLFLSVKGYRKERKKIAKNHFGKMVILVSATSRSSIETAAISTKFAFLPHASNVQMVGLPTAGVTGSITTLVFPEGGNSESYPVWTPTPSYPVFNGETFQFRGMRLEHTFTIQELMKEVPDPDLLMAALFKYVTKVKPDGSDKKK